MTTLIQAFLVVVANLLVKNIVIYLHSKKNLPTPSYICDIKYIILLLNIFNKRKFKIKCFLLGVLRMYDIM